ncbi:adenylate kinase [Arcicella rosea]|uniref:Adenylate kinase family enzyme n=1 Tax=Arcicella rosea TaxID=502909 RepID=A0A841EMC7_9BACT|nr:adenylate kinase [Arcicella rosea]MBB6001470.1 adenylate kinase family enzyme [Arcicella rosea]
MKIHILGASSSGVTTLGNALSQQLNIPYFDSDEYYWEKSDPPFTIRRNPSDRTLMIKKDIEKAKDWILGGSIISWGDIFPRFDLIVFLWLPPHIRMERLKEREFSRYGNIIYTDLTRIKQYNDFIAWSADYDNHTGIATRTLNAHENWLKQMNIPILEIRGDYSTQERIQLILKKLSEL